jgi:hypothetical protein
VIGRSARFWTLAILVTALTAVGVRVMQSRFDAADLRNAADLVRTYTAAGPRTLEEVVSRRHPDARITWHSSLRSGCFGYVRVRCRAGRRTYLWDVDMGSVSIHPANPAGRSILRQMERDRGGPS